MVRVLKSVLICDISSLLYTGDCLLSIISWGYCDDGAGVVASAALGAWVAFCGAGVVTITVGGCAEVVTGLVPCEVGVALAKFLLDFKAWKLGPLNRPIGVWPALAVCIEVVTGIIVAALDVGTALDVGIEVVTGIGAAGVCLLRIISL